MAELDTYKQKRNFKKTSEPEGGKPQSDRLLFVVQKHAASHLHYDFRLEVKGVLKSWAVPRGPSIDPDERRLAQPVEDHPYDYKDFEGIIPKGQYGGGTVIVWDEGWYEPVEKLPTKKEQEHWMLSNYYKNALEIVMHGQKLKGKFILIKFKDDKYPGSWRLIKAPDEYASKEDILLKDKSVVSGLTIEQMAKKNGAAVWNSNRESIHVEKEEHSGIAAAMPQKAEPMLCTLIDEPFTDSDWQYEVKFDGYRVIGSKKGNQVKLNSRKGLNYTKKFAELVEELERIGNDFVIDGEVVVLNDKGQPDFDALQRYKSGDPLAYYVFDILWLDGYDLQSLPLTERREQLQSILPESDIMRYSRDFDDGKALFEAIKTQGLEGIVCKRKDSRYQAGKRGKDWLKLHTDLTQDFVVGAWTESDTAHAFRSLIFGNYVNGKFTYVGHVGGGFKDKDRPSILKKLEKLETQQNPFGTKIETDTKPHWLRPELVITVKFATWTKGGALRKPATFIGFRPDKKAEEVTAEVPLSETEEQQLVQQPQAEAPAFSEADLNKPSEESNWPKILNRKITSSHDLEVAGYNLTIDNIEREIWTGVPKAKLLAYYGRISKYLLPYLKDRPISPHIKNAGPMKPGFYQKDMEGQTPEFVETFRDVRKHPKKGKRSVIDYAMINNEAALLYFVNIGCIDVNPWASTAQHPTIPDYMTIDLDPWTGEDFPRVIDTAKAVKEVLDKHKLKSVVKTSGKRGLHIFLPCGGFDTVAVKGLAKKLYDEVHELVPELVTDIFNKDQRKGKIFIDYTLNDYADTMASVYSVRPNYVPSVSTPLSWKEVNNGLHPADFTIENILDRIEKKGDLFQDLFNPKWVTANNKILKQL
jgi:bifunctional non-homologous end joining protein LigD